MSVVSRLMIAVLLLSISHVSWADESSLAVFNLSSYEDWYYNRSDVELNTDNISHLRIKLFNRNGEVLSLTSPVIDCSGYDSLSVEVEYVVIEQDGIDYKKLPLTVSMLNEGLEPIDSKTSAVNKGSYVNNLTFNFNIPSTQNSCRFKLAALKADKDSNGAVRTIVIKGYKSSIIGDVNSDGIVDITDVNALVNMIITNINTGRKGDVNGDGCVDVSDINFIINLLLN